MEESRSLATLNNFAISVGTAPSADAVTPAGGEAHRSDSWISLLCFAGQPTGQHFDLLVSNREAVIHQERVGKTGAVERAINLDGHNSLVLTLGYLDDGFGRPNRSSRISAAEKAARSAFLDAA